MTPGHLLNRVPVILMMMACHHLLLHLLLRLLSLSPSLSVSHKTYLVWFLRNIHSARRATMTFLVLKKGVVTETGTLESPFSICLSYSTFIHGHEASPTPTRTLQSCAYFRRSPSFNPRSVLQVAATVMISRSEMRIMWRVRELLKTTQEFTLRPVYSLLWDS